MKKIGLVVLALSLVWAGIPAYAEEAALAGTAASAPSGTYLENMKGTLLRGVKNVLGSPLEIPITIQEYHEGAGRPVIRHMAGAIDGLFRMVVRAGSGAWDFIAALIPGHQEGMPPDPETLF